MNELIQHLSVGNHPVVFSRGASTEVLKQSIDRGFVLVKFTDTQGGTELGMKLDDQTQLGEADFNQAKGIAHLSGSLVLNYVKVRCLVDIDLATLRGQGHLEIIQ